MSVNFPGPVLQEVDDHPVAADRGRLASCYQDVRRTTEALCAPLETEDYVVQSMPDASPAKWHLAHSSWFFDTFVLKPEGADDRSSSAQYSYLFNSYYNALGERIPRPERGLLSRPTVAEVYRYRAAIDDRMCRFLERAGDDVLRRVGPTLVLGLHHEQQHQELILTDLKHMFSRNPLRPVYREQEPTVEAEVGPVGWISAAAGLRAIGREGAGFAFDNERPRHPAYVGAFRLADRLVTNGEYRAFIEDRGYDRPELWLSDGWNARVSRRWTAPLYWEKSCSDEGWRIMTLAGMRDLVASEPVCHVSYYEADAYARWAGARLPTEAEWEVAAGSLAIDGNFLENERYHPAPIPSPAGTDLPAPAQMFGDVWEWTQSPYTPYPGFRPLAGALGEYNGKFMCNQMVLRGGSCATPRSHIRATYRNFFPPEARWQFSGVRLAEDA
jgi:ergothioneine biosynthesis protein EgtB